MISHSPRSARDLPEPLVFPDEWTLGQPDLVITLDRPYAPNPLGEASVAQGSKRPAAYCRPANV